MRRLLGDLPSGGDSDGHGAHTARVEDRADGRAPQGRIATLAHGIGKRFVYILRSDRDPGRHYVGLTGDVDSRLEWHNHGPCGHTLENRPWSLVVVLEFPSEQEACQFEKYLKTGSGRAFAKRHLARDAG